MNRPWIGNISFDFWQLLSAKQRRAKHKAYFCRRVIRKRLAAIAKPGSLIKYNRRTFMRMPGQGLLLMFCRQSSSIFHRFQIISAFWWFDNRPEAEIADIAYRWHRLAEVVWQFNRPIWDCCFGLRTVPIYLLPFLSFGVSCDFPKRERKWFHH